MNRLTSFLNPIAHLGDRKYSYFFPLLSTLGLYCLSEVFTYQVLKNPMGVGIYIIYVSAAIIIYFSFREGVRGGIIATLLTVAYYLYIISSRHYSGQNRIAGIETTAVLGVLFLIIALIIGWLKQTIDVLIEREADEKKRLQTIIQQLPVGVIVTDSTGKIVQTNRQLDKILGMKMPLGVVAGKDIVVDVEQNGKPIHPSHSPLAQALASGKSVKDKEFIVKRPDGKNAYINVSASLIRNNRDKVIAAASIISDITQQKEIEKRKDDFVNMASHELKTPLTSMKLYLETLLKRSAQLDDRTTKTLTSIKNQTDRLQELVNGLLDVSRLQTGKMNFSKELFRLDFLTQELVSELQGTTRQQQLLYSGKTPVTIFGDRFRIYQVLTNFITNAVKYSPAGSDIAIKVKKVNGMAMVSVTDKGIGIAKDQQKKVFDRLYQVADNETNTFPGLGMGLYISKEIIKRHKGSIWVESEKGKGSTFYFTIPLAKKS